MATLFGHFSFDTPSPSRADHETEQAQMNCSPCSMPARTHFSRPSTPPPCTMSDLAQLMGGQKLLSRPHHHIPAGPPTPPSETDTFPTKLDDSDDSDTLRPIYCRASASIMRMQRQAHSRLQCCSSQARDISRLVRMIREEEQCSVTDTASALSSTSADEGIDMDYDCALRVTEPQFSRPPPRAADRHSDAVRVTKSARMRKRSSLVRESIEIKERRKTR